MIIVSALSSVLALAGLGVYLLSGWMYLGTALVGIAALWPILYFLRAYGLAGPMSPLPRYARYYLLSTGMFFLGYASSLRSNATANAETWLWFSLGLICVLAGAMAQFRAYWERKLSNPC